MTTAAYAFASDGIQRRRAARSPAGLTIAVAISLIARAKSEPGSASTAGLPAVHGQRHRPVARHLEADLRLERRLDLGPLQPDVRVGAVEDDPDPVRRERQQLERLQAQPDVLDRRHLEPADEQQLVGAVERRQHRPVEERRRVDDDHVVRLARDLEQAGQLRLGDQLGVLRPDRRREDVEPGGVVESCSPPASRCRARPARPSGPGSSGRARCRA